MSALGVENAVPESLQRGSKPDRRYVRIERQQPLQSRRPPSDGSRLASALRFCRSMTTFGESGRWTAARPDPYPVLIAALRTLA